jgi:hypothetical protein
MSVLDQLPGADRRTCAAPLPDGARRVPTGGAA